jgi:hypothetical protein
VIGNAFHARNFTDPYTWVGVMEANVEHEIWGEMDDWLGDMDGYQDDAPEAFWYVCCYEDGTTKGCTYGRHWTLDDGQGQVSSPDAKEVAEGTKDAAICH